MKGIVFILAVLTCSVSFGQQRVYHATGYYQYNAQQCKWVWYGYAAKAASNYDTKTYITNYNNYGAQAVKGNTEYGISNFDSAAYLGGPSDESGLIELAKLLGEGSVKLGGNAFQLASYRQSERTDVARELLGVQKIYALKELSESTKIERGSVHVEHHAEVNSSTPAVTDLSGIASKCASCHSEGAASAKGGEVVLPAFDALNREQVDLVFNYVTTLDDRNCARKAQLSTAEHAALRDYLCERKAGK